MPIIEITKNHIKLVLWQALSKVRIADQNGNHIKSPTTQGKNIDTNFVEWMISNAQIKGLIDNYLISEDKEELKNIILPIDVFLNRSKYSVRESLKTTQLGKFKYFDIYKYEETFYSFERVLESGIKIRLTFKMGDYALAVHMFILLPFKKKIIDLYNNIGKIERNCSLGSGCHAIWKPTKEEIFAIVDALSHASEGHKKDLLNMLN